LTEISEAFADKENYRTTPSSSRPVESAWLPMLSHWREPLAAAFHRNWMALPRLSWSLRKQGRVSNADWAMRACA